MMIMMNIKVNPKTPSLSFTSASSSSHLSQGFKTLFAREFVTTPAFTTTCYADRLSLSLTSNTTSLRTAISKTIKVYLSLDPALGTGQVYPAPNKAWHSSPPPQYRQALWNNLVARGASQRVVLSPEVDKLVRTSMESRLEWGFLPFSCSLGAARESREFRDCFVWVFETCAWACRVLWFFSLMGSVFF